MTSGLWRGIEGRVLEVVASGDDPGERARALIDILRGADEDWTWDEDYDRGWARRADGFGPAVDAQVDIGSPAVEALLEAETPGDSWYATLAVLALKGLVEEGHAVHRLPEVLEWCQRNSLEQDIIYSDAVSAIFERAGAAAEPALREYLLKGGRDIHAVGFTSRVLEDADPAWATPVAEGLLRELMEREADSPQTWRMALTWGRLGGADAAPLLREVLAGRRAGERKEGSPAHALMDAMLELELGDRQLEDLASEAPLTGPACDLVGSLPGPGETVPCLSTDGVCRPDCPLQDVADGPPDMQSLSRAQLPRVSAELGLDPGGSRTELLDRVAEHLEREMGLLVDPVPRDELEGMPFEDLRIECELLGLEEHGGRGELVERLAAFYEGRWEFPEVGEPFEGTELSDMTVPELGRVCVDMGLPEDGGMAELTRRILEAQRGRPGDRG